MASSFELIYAVVRQIPRGMVTTYGTVARLAGNPRWARVVGYALHANPEPYEEEGAGDATSENSAPPNFEGFHTESANAVNARGIPRCDATSENSAPPNFEGFHTEGANAINARGIPRCDATSENSAPPNFEGFHTEGANAVNAKGIPCQRVLNRFGEVCEGFVFGGANVQREMLEREGVEFELDGRVDLKKFGWFV